MIVLCDRQVNKKIMIHVLLSYILSILFLEKVINHNIEKLY